MERDNFKTQITQRIAIYVAAAVITYGIMAFCFSAVSSALVNRTGKSINVLVLTREPMFISYNPKAKKAVVSIINPVGKKKSTLRDALAQASISQGDFMYVEPYTQDREQFWSDFKENLHFWRLKPYLLFAYCYDYAKLKKEKRTDIDFTDFMLLSQEMTTLEPADFSVINKIITKRTRHKDQTAPEIALAQDIMKPAGPKKPIVIEIFNASGKSGMAGDVTRYLREQNNNGKLNLDVINYSNYTVTEPQTQIINHTGDVEELKNISVSLGIGDKEILSKTDKTSISDAKIILGRDFVLPKNINK